MTPDSSPSALVENEEQGSTMMLSASEYKALTHHNQKFTPEERIEAVLAYYTHSEASKAARTLTSGITAKNIISWKRTAPWWDAMLEKCRQLKDDELESKMTNTLHRAVTQLEERVRLGDKVVSIDKEGNKTTVRTPVNARDLVYIASMLTDKRSILQGRENTKTKGIHDQLQKISSQLIQTLKDAKKPLPGVTVTQLVPESDIIDVN